MSRRSGLWVVYPAKEVEVVVGVDVLSEGWGGVCDGDSEVESCCGGSVTGTPVRECRSGGIIESDCVVGVRMSRRRGLAMCLDCDLDGSAGEMADAVGVMVGYVGCVAAIEADFEGARSFR